MVHIITRVSHSVAGGAGLESLLSLWRAMIEAEEATQVYTLGIQVLIDLGMGKEDDISKEVGCEWGNMLGVYCHGQMCGDCFQVSSIS